MQSPKFPLKIKDLREVINASRLRTTWRNKVREAMRRQLVPDPLEHLDFHTKLDALCTLIEAEICSGNYIPKVPTRFLSEKSQGLCRQLVIPSTKDALVLQTLSDALWAEIKKESPSKNSFFAPDDHKFSRVIRGHTSDYGPLQAWISFQETIFGFAQRRPFIVVTDIANYYDFISYDHLRNILAELSVAKEHALDLLIHTLSCMLWQPDYMPRVPVGLPQMNLDAPRLLAHCFLFEIDRLLVHQSNIEFARYMDDMDIGVNSVAEGRAILRDLDLALQTRQIRLNSGKTKILSEAEARAHFKIRENALLDSLHHRIKEKLDTAQPIAREKKTVELALDAGFRKGIFKTGNGEKILKRLLNFANTTKASVREQHFEELLRKWPASRPTVLRWWLTSLAPEETLWIIADFVCNGEIVDDASLMEVAKSIVSARLPMSKEVDNQINRILEGIDQKRPWSFYARCWIASKYRPPDEVIRLVEANGTLWVTQEHLSRLVGGLYPRTIRTAYRKRFDSFVRRHGNPWSQAVLDFHINLEKGTKGFTSIKKFISAENYSLPNRISHPKFLMLLSLLHNPDLEPAAVDNLRAIHAVALTDNYYAQWIP